MKRAGFGFLWLTLGIVTLGIVGSLTYNAGLSAGLAASASQTAVAVVSAYGWGFGFGNGGVCSSRSCSCSCSSAWRSPFSGRRRGWGPPGGYGRWWPTVAGTGRVGIPEGMAPDDLPPPIRGTLERWHADAHGPAPDAGQGGGPSSAEPPGPTTGA